MFKVPYFYYFIVAWFLITCLQRVVGRGRVDVGAIMQKSFPKVILAICTIALVVFLILGFWFMPKWWYPLAFIGCSIVAAFIPLPDKVGALIALVAAPVLTVLAYLSLFGVIA